MTHEAYFFSHLLGEHWGHQLKLGPSSRSGYTLCVYTGAKPNAEKGSVLHLNLKKRTGMHDCGMSWQIHANDHERTGHAWDDNMPDAALVPYPFEDWVLDQLQRMIHRFARMGLRDAIDQLKNQPPEDREAWQELQSRLREAQQRLGMADTLPDPDAQLENSGFQDSSQEDGWQVTLGLARCALELGDFNEVSRYTARFSNGYFPEGFSCLAMCDSGVQELLPPLLEHDEAFWAPLMAAPMKQLHGYPEGKPSWGGSARNRFFEWLRTVKSPKVMGVWVDEALKAEARPDKWFRYAAMMEPERMADSIIQLMGAVVDKVGETAEHLFLLLPALQHADRADRAKAVAGQLKALGFTDKVRAWQVALKEGYWTLPHRPTPAEAVEKMDGVHRLLELEDRLNSHWRGRPESEWDRHIREQHFVCIGTLRWVAWWRTAGKPEEAIKRIQQFFSDWELVVVLHRADTKNMEELIDSACIALIETGREEQARDLLVRVMASIPPTDNEQTHYDYACIFARCGDMEGVVEPLKTYLNLVGETEGQSKARLRVKNDPDFDHLRGDARFQALLTLER